MGSPAPPGSRAGATAQGHASTTARPGVPVARAETIAMTATEHDDAVEAIAALIFRTWEDKAEAA